MSMCLWLQGLLVVSHDTELLLGIADDVWEMKSGGYLAGKMR